MKILFDDNRKILGAFSDNGVPAYTGAHIMYCPFDINNKLIKSHTITQQKHDASGKALFVNSAGVLTTQEFVKTAGRLVENFPAVETIVVSRPVSVWEAPTEWTLGDVYTFKYDGLAAGQNYWFDEFTNFDAVDLASSRFSAGFNSIAINPGDTVMLKPLALVNKTTKLSVYVESGDNFNSSLIDVGASIDGQTFQSGTISSKRSFQEVFIKLSNKQTEPVAVHAVAVFY